MKQIILTRIYSTLTHVAFHLSQIKRERLAQQTGCSFSDESYFTRHAVGLKSVGVSLVAGICLIAAEASAKTYSKFKVGNWQGSIQINSQTGAFTHCVASAHYKSGISLLFSVNKNQQWSVGFSKVSWALPQGGQKEVRYQIDGGEILSGVAVAVTPQVARLSLPGNISLFNHMRRGRLLKVAVGDDVLEFKLTSTGRLLKTLTNCAFRNRGLVTQTGGAASGHSKSAFAPPTSSNLFSAKSISNDPRPITEGGERITNRNQRRFQATGHAQNIIKQIGVTAKFLSPEGAPGLYELYDSVWQMSNFTGALRVVPMNDIAAIDAKLLADERARCSGAFDTRNKPASVSGIDGKMRLASCARTDGSKWTALHTIYPRRDGTTYVMTIFTAKEKLENVLKVGETFGKLAIEQAARSRS